MRKEVGKQKNFPIFVPLKRIKYNIIHKIKQQELWNL